ncbi:FdhF/YdeP family oxidoreductase [Aestuariibacter salexigens]|uniref:FdhF/YdeP family oxidoreductase n=1 Tax=Aestuariibacter salexigens TaxID=226010 RepID=UPI000412E9D6|nr:FdhF/YdeP family oxidoreductase [Aestuariibacter salexigens]
MPDKPRYAGGLPSIKSTVSELIKSKRVRQNINNLYKMNKHKGFDCPGCAWGDEKDGTFKFCENGAKAVAWESTDKRIGKQFFAQFTLKELRDKSNYWLESQGRLVEPLRYHCDTDKYHPISWQQAFALIAQKLNGLDDPNQLELYTSGRASNEAAFLYQLFGRAFGTNNFPDCSNMCHEASGIALKQSIGVGKGTVVLDDFNHTECIFVFGQNPGSNHPRMLNALRKAAKNGTKIVTFNNLKEVGLQRFASPQAPAELFGLSRTTISHDYLTPKLGGDLAAVRGIAKAILDTYPQAIDHDFIKHHTQRFDAYTEVVNATSWQQIEKQSGLCKPQLEHAAHIFATAKNRISAWAMGITQHRHSVATIREISNLHLLTGAIGKKGSGLCPVRGHSNVQGNRTMGIVERPTPDFLNKLQRRFVFAPPTKPGHKTYDAIKALHTSASKILICLGGNIAAASADTAYAQEALGKADFIVNIATKLNRTHVNLKHDGLLLPCLGRTEIDRKQGVPQIITVEDTFSMVHGSMGSCEPISASAKSEIDIVANIADKVLGARVSIDWQRYAADYSAIRDAIADTIDGFNNFNHHIKQPGGFHLRNDAAHKCWNTDSGFAEFFTGDLPSSLYPDDVAEIVEKANEPVFTLQTLRSHDQYNTTVYGFNDRYRGVNGKRNVLFMNKVDMQFLSIFSGQRVDVTTLWNDNTKRQLRGMEVVEYDIPQGNVAAYYPEANPLVPFESVGEQSITPTSKSIPVVITLNRINLEAAF